MLVKVWQWHSFKIWQWYCICWFSFTRCQFPCQYLLKLSTSWLMALEKTWILIGHRWFCALGNTLTGKCHVLTANVKINLLRTLCTLLYTVQILCISLENWMAYNDMRYLLHLLRYHNARQLFANIDVPASQESNIQIDY